MTPARERKNERWAMGLAFIYLLIQAAVAGWISAGR
jgi:hypothetical protein